MSLEKRWQDWANVLFGIWLIVSPYILGYTDTGTLAATHSYAIGIAVVVFAFAAIYRYYRWEEGINLVLGLWLIAAPFVLDFAHVEPAAWNHVATGILIGIDALSALLQKPHLRRTA